MSNMALPIDIPWKRLATSADMMDTQYGDRKFPPKWRSSISIFYHEPTDLPETYCDRKITYLKVVCSITGYQVGPEVGVTYPATDDAWHELATTLGKAYHPCYGALLHVAVFPKTADGKSIPLSEYPYIADFEPKRRELYDAVTRSEEILGRSSSTLNLHKSGTNAETGQLVSRLGDNAAQTDQDQYTDQNVRTTDRSRERRETYSATTGLTQMYELFTGFHLGTNRAVFNMMARPHTTEEKDQYTFVNGPRRLEGIQEVFLIVNRPKGQPGLCVEAYLETAHLFAETAETPEDQPSNTNPDPPITYTQAQFTTNWTELWNQSDVGVGAKKGFARNLMYLPEGCELDVSRPSPPQSFGVDPYGPANNPLPALTITVPAGLFFNFDPDGVAYTFWRSLSSIDLEVRNNGVYATVALRYGGGMHKPKFNADVTIYYKCPQTPEPSSTSLPVPNKPIEKPLFLTSRGLSACIVVAENESSQLSNVFKPVNLGKMLHTDSREKLLEWLYRHHVLDLGPVPEEEYREKLNELMERNSSEFEEKVRDSLNTTHADSIPDEWLLPNEWVSFETTVPTSGLMSDPRASALERIRAANALTSRIGLEMIESLGSSRRYEDRAVDFWHTNMALNRLSRVVSSMPDDAPENVPILRLGIPFTESFVAEFGKDVRRKELAGLDLSSLRGGLGITENEARDLRLQILRTPAEYVVRSAEPEGRTPVRRRKGRSASS